MQWRRLLLGGGAALGAAATYNALARRGVHPIPNTLGGEEGSFRWRGHWIAYTRHGVGPPVLLVHGIHIAASSFEWRHNVRALARNYTVFAIDLVGFGRSDRPAIRYSPSLFVALIADFASQVIRAPVTLVASSLSAGYAIALAARDAGRYPAVVAVVPSGLPQRGRSPRARADVARAVVDTPVLGTAVFNGLVSRKSLREFLEQSYADNTHVTDALVEQYYQIAHQPGAKHAPAAFVSGRLHSDVRGALRRLLQPMLLVWGEQAVRSPVEEVFGFRSLKPDLELAIVQRAGDLPHDERPDEFNAIALAFLDRVGSGSMVGP